MTGPGWELRLYAVIVVLLVGLLFAADYRERVGGGKPPPLQQPWECVIPSSPCAYRDIRETV